MNHRLAAVGILTLALALAVGTGAFTSGDELTGVDTSGSVYFSPQEGPNGDAYATVEDGEISLVVDRLNAQAETVVDDLFVVGYDGDGTAEVWVEHGSDAVTFYGAASPIEDGGPDERLFLSGDETASVGMSVETGSADVLLDEVTLVALLPDEEGFEFETPETGGAGEGLVETETETATDDDRTRVSVDVGEISVGFRQPEFAFETSVSESEIGVRQTGVAGQVATVIDDDAPETEETVVVESEIRNTGTASGTTAAALRVNGRAIDTRDVELGPDEATNISFVVGFDQPGQYEVAVGESEPVTVSVTDASPDLLPFAAVALLAPLVAVFLMLRRRREENE